MSMSANGFTFDYDITRKTQCYLQEERTMPLSDSSFCLKARSFFWVWWSLLHMKTT